MNPLLKRNLIIIGVIPAVLGIGALILEGVYKRGKWSKKHDRYSERSSCCKCCSSDNDDEDDDDEDEEDSRGKMMKKYDGNREDMPMMKKDKKD